VNGYCLNEFTFLHVSEVIPCQCQKGGYPLTFLSLGKSDNLNLQKIVSSHSANLTLVDSETVFCDSTGNRRPIDPTLQRTTAQFHGRNISETQCLRAPDP
jgi:hypothetical protein